MQYFITFIEGIITFISPCFLPMIPIYVSYLTKENDGENKKTGTFIKALFFVLGFTSVFLILGLFAGSIGMFLTQYKKIVNIICGIIVILFGLYFLGVFKINLFGSKSRKINIDGPFSAFLFGTVFSVSWTPCVGAFLGSALMLASQQGSVITGLLLLLCYSAGLGIPFMLSALAIDRLKNVFNGIKKHYKTINLISGIFLIIIGILMITGIFDKLFIVR